MSRNKFLKLFFKTVAFILCLIVVVLLGFYIRLKLDKVIDISPSAYSWNLSEKEIEAQARELVSKMSLEEKISQMSGDENSIMRLSLGMVFQPKINPIVYSGYNEKLGIPPIAFSDGPRGLTVAKGATDFPVTMARGASWDRDLEQRVGDAFGKEIRAANANYMGSLCINILRHPSWGRAQETYGEDPWLLGEMGVALFKGIDQHNVMTCAKHFVCNNMEYSRHYVSAEVDERILREVYLPHFKKVIDTGVPSVMSAYNKVNGEYCGQNHFLIEGILRNDWGFTGFVTSDWMQGVYDGEKAAKAGLNVEMPRPKHYGKNLIQLIEERKVSEERIDELVTEIVRTKLKYASRKDRMVYPQELIGSKDHVDLAKEIAEKSMVLLKNENQTLPLDQKKVRKIAVIGHLSDVENTGDRGSSYVRPEYIVTALEGIRNYLGNRAEVLHATGENLDEVRKIASQVDAVIMIAGYDHHDEGEYIILEEIQRPRTYEEEMEYQENSIKFLPFDGKDRLDLHLKERDLEVIKTASEVNDKLVVSIIGGSAVMMEEWQDQAEAILMMWYAGMEGGNALAKILFGEVNPSGKLPFTIPADASQLTTFDGFAESVEYEYYHGYTKVDKMNSKPAFPFGFGLSYTTFKYESLNIVQKDIFINDTLKAAVAVTNTGIMAGEEVVQMYVGFNNSKVDRPVKLLRGFEKIHLNPGEVKRVHFSLPVNELAWYNPESKSWEIEEMEYELYVGSSSVKEDLLISNFIVTNQLH